MIKINDFWQELCLRLNYNFFAGVPFEEFSIVFNTMNSKFLHYVPTTNESSAIGIATGFYLGGYKSVALFQANGFDLVKLQIEDINIKHELPILILTESIYNPMNLKQFELSNGISVIEKADKYLLESKKSTIIVVKPGDLIK